MPPELFYAIVSMSIAVGQPQAGLVILLCFCGTMRVSEAMNLKYKDVVLGYDCLVLWLGVT